MQGTRTQRGIYLTINSNLLCWIGFRCNEYLRYVVGEIRRRQRLLAVCWSETSVVQCNLCLIWLVYILFDVDVERFSWVRVIWREVMWKIPYVFVIVWRAIYPTGITESGLIMTWRQHLVTAICLWALWYNNIWEEESLKTKAHLDIGNMFFSDR